MPSTSALLLIDLQNHFCAHNAKAQEAARLCAKFSAQIRGQMPVLHAAYIYSSCYAPRVQRGIRFQNGNHIQFFHENIGGFYIAHPHVRDFVFLKATDDLTRSNPYIIQFLDHRKISRIYIAGVNTSACVLDTAKSLRREGFEVTILEDLCADSSRDRYRVEELLAKASDRLGIHRGTSTQLIPNF